MRRFTLFLILCVAVLSGAASLCTGATRRAVLIGINQYNPPSGQVSTDPAKKSPARKALVSGDVRHWTYPDLEGAVNDVNLIEGLLLAPDFGFQPGDIVKLITPEKTTADGILSTLRHELVETASSGDIRLVYYSGHGNYIRNAALKRANSNTRNEFDQTIVTSDQWQGAVDIRDKEISQILWDAAKKGVIVTFIADSCHSGSLTRGPSNTRGTSRSNSGVRSGADAAGFGEPLIDDPAPIDKATGNEINPEEAGVLTLAAAQENQEALELRTDKNETHGAMTTAFVRAIREEGPHASMDRIFERMWNYMQAENLTQTPILGGVERGDKDLFGQPARQEPFSVIAAEIRGDSVILRGGEAIGLYAGSELRRLSDAAAAQPVTLTVTSTSGLSQATATVNPAGSRVAVGDRFEVTKWAAPQEPNLRVYIPPAADVATIAQMSARLAPLRQDASLHWVEDPTTESPTDILRWNSTSWVLDHVAATVKTSNLGASPALADIKKLLPNGTRLLVLMPPDTAMSATITLGEGTRYPGIQKLQDADAQNADYRFCGRLTAAGIQYAWVQADAGPPKQPASKSAVAKSASPLPVRTDWLDAKSETAAATLTEYAVRIGKVRAWLTLSGRPGQTEFPYRLVLRKPSSDAAVRGPVLYGGEQYKLFLQLDPQYKDSSTTRRWVYVFAVSQEGKGTLLFPQAGSGNEGNHLPRAEKDERPTATVTPSIRLLDQPYDLEIGEPWGTDTYIMISTKEAIPNPGIFDFEGVQTTRGARGLSGNPLQDLLEENGNSTRGTVAARSPGEWSIERMSFQSAPKK